MDHNKSRHETKQMGRSISNQVIFDRVLHERMLQAITKVEKLQLQGWVKPNGRCNIAMFIRACVESTCDALETT